MNESKTVVVVGSLRLGVVGGLCPDNRFDAERLITALARNALSSANRRGHFKRVETIISAASQHPHKTRYNHRRRQ